ncbi:MAG: ribosome biogenesis GTP-binding protein YihA/YsxC [Gemmatimonadota bacterium]|nr:ribosome biogenesis GTP-binding protein YihA/YsxC [Gemmatimonadota bacterium]
MIIRTFEPACEIRTLSDQWPEDLPQVAFAGRSNVGKSSLINRLVGRKRAVRTSSTPGKTRKIHFYKVNGSFYLVDLPGYGYARLPVEVRKKWQKLIERYLEGSRNLRGVVSLIDIRHQLFDSDRRMLEYLAARGIPAMAVLTKADKLSRSKQQQMAARLFGELEGTLAPEQLLTVSALNGTGCERLLEAIEELLSGTEAEGAKAEGTK